MAVRWRSAYERVSIALHPLQVLWLRSQRVFLYFRTLFPQLVVPLSFSSGTPLLPFFFFAFALLALAISLNRVGQPLLCHSFVSTLKRRAAHSLHLSGGVSGACCYLTSMVYHSIVRGMQEQHTKHVTYKIAYHFVWCPSVKSRQNAPDVHSSKLCHIRTFREFTSWMTTALFTCVSSALLLGELALQDQFA